MEKRWVVFLFLLMPLVHSMSLADLVSRYSFSESSGFNFTSFGDYPVDSDENGIADLIILELETSGKRGNFTVSAVLFDKNGHLVNESKVFLLAGASRINLSFRTYSLSQDRFNYSLAVYNGSNFLVYRKMGIPTNSYPEYEKAFEIENIKDRKNAASILIEVEINSSISGNFEVTAFLNFNGTNIAIKENKTISSSLQKINLTIPPEKIKKYRIMGKFNITSLKIGEYPLKPGFLTSSYDFRDFSSNYIGSFSDSGIDSDGNGKFDILRISASLNVSGGRYSIVAGLYDYFGSIIAVKNQTEFLDSSGVINMDFNGSFIYNKKLNGPYMIRHAALYRDFVLEDEVENAYESRYYSYSDFDGRHLPDLKVDIIPSDEYHYGSNNITINVSVRNNGPMQAFNVFFLLFDNATLHKQNISGLVNAGSEKIFSFRLYNVSDTELTSFVDMENIVDELNESNNFDIMTIKINMRPVILGMDNVTARETSRIRMNISAFDGNGDNLTFSSNISSIKFQPGLLLWDTSTTESGHYAVEVVASDRYLNSSSVLEIDIIDAPEEDSDNDGINESVDRIYGDEKSINSSTVNVTLFIRGERNTSRTFDSIESVKIFDSNVTILEFDFDFSKNLTLHNVSIEKQSANGTGFVIVRGLSSGITKSVYIDKIKEQQGVCIKDSEINSVAEISSFCNFVDEFPVECDGTLQFSYKCAYNSSTGKYKVSGLSHSGVMQYGYTKPEEEVSLSGESASSSGGGCLSRWNCSQWSSCRLGNMKRKCEDILKCRIKTGVPEEKIECSGEPGFFDFISFDSQASGIKENKTADNKTMNKNSITGNVADSISSVSVDFFDVISILAVLSIVVVSIFGLLQHNDEGNI